ncbi:MAG: glycosyltransferase [Xenococcus sp. MO_188.B8]|nr:glycosyltransferase [Xenococcus sp. MO_188.B8]
MRIFTAVSHSIDPNFFYGGLWSRNFYPALKQLEHEVIESQVDLLPASLFMDISCNFTKQELQIRHQITERIVEEILQAHFQKPVDLFLCYFYNSHFDPAGFEEIDRLGIPSVNFYCNSIYQFELVSSIAANATFSWHPERDARSLYLGVGGNPIWVQMGADPRLYHFMPNVTRQTRACFVGQRYADRDRLLAKLIKNQIPVDIYGNGWAHNSQRQIKTTNQSNTDNEIEYLGRRLLKSGSFESYSQAILSNLTQQGILKGGQRTLNQLLYRHYSKKLDALLASASQGFADNLSETFAQYELILNFSNVWADGRPGSALIPHVRLRDFEAPMSRTCYLTGYTDEIAEFYELGKEIDTYRHSDELVDKANYYLNHPSEAEKLREAGYQRALRDHTWKNRFEQLFKTIGLKTSKL